MQFHYTGSLSLLELFKEPRFEQNIRQIFPLSFKGLKKYHVLWARAVENHCTLCGPCQGLQEENVNEEVRDNSEKPFHQDLMRKENKIERKGPIINTQTMQLKQF